MIDAVVIDAVRTPIGRHGGALSRVRPDDLAAIPIRALVERTGIAPASIEEVILGCANQAGEDNRNVARMAALRNASTKRGGHARSVRFGHALRRRRAGRSNARRRGRRMMARRCPNRRWLRGERRDSFERARPSRLRVGSRYSTMRYASL